LAPLDIVADPVAVGVGVSVFTVPDGDDVPLVDGLLDGVTDLVFVFEGVIDEVTVIVAVTLAVVVIVGVTLAVLVTVDVIDGVFDAVAEIEAVADSDADGDAVTESVADRDAVTESVADRDAVTDRDADGDAVLDIVGDIVGVIVFVADADAVFDIVGVIVSVLDGVLVTVAVTDCEIPVDAVGLKLCDRVGVIDLVTVIVGVGDRDIDKVTEAVIDFVAEALCPADCDTEIDGLGSTEVTILTQEPAIHSLVPALLHVVPSNNTARLLLELPLLFVPHRYRHTSGWLDAPPQRLSILDPDNDRPS